MNTISNSPRWHRAAACCAAALLAATAHAGPGFRDPLTTAATLRSAPEKRPLMALTHAGTRLVAVGSRGLIVGSADGGKSWSQASVPVQTDLLAVHFPTATEGWATGHNGVVLYSADGGKHWRKQLDGRIAGAVFKTYYADSAGVASPPHLAAFAQVGLNYKSGPTLPFLDIWFADTQQGYVVGSFGLIAATTDGGKYWEPWLHRIDNPEGLNLNAVRGIAGEVYIVGERGQIYRLDRKLGRFTRTDTGYAGSFFGIVGNGQTLLAYGLGGTVYRSTDGGERWEALKMPSQQTISAGIALDPGEGFLLINAAGQLLQADDKGDGFRVVPSVKPMRATGLAALPARVVAISSLQGVTLQQPSATASASR